MKEFLPSRPHLSSVGLVNLGFLPASGSNSNLPGLAGTGIPLPPSSSASSVQQQGIPPSLSIPVLDLSKLKRTGSARGDDLINQRKPTIAGAIDASSVSHNGLGKTEDHEKIISAGKRSSLVTVFS
jgi:hypothetical protein